MAYVHTTWYVLQDGTPVDPNDVAPDDKGKLRHKSGGYVGMRPDGNPQTMGIDPASPPSGKRARKPEKETEAPETADMAPETPKRGYKTRETKAE